MELENKCIFYEISRNQRETERSNGLGDRGTGGFERQGCYSCDGLNKSCKAYYENKN